MLMLLLCAVPVSSVTVRELFAEMPDSILPLLSKVNRLDMLDFMDSGLDAIVKNNLDGNSELVEMNDGYMKIRYTANSELVLKLFFGRDSVPVIALVHTVVLDKLRSSLVDFYSPGWYGIDRNRVFLKPGVADFVRPDRKDCKKKLKNSGIQVPVAIEVSADGCGFDVSCSGTELYDDDICNFSDCMRETPLCYVWNGKKLVKRK